MKKNKQKALKIVDAIYEAIKGNKNKELEIDAISVKIELEEYKDACSRLAKFGLPKQADRIRKLMEA